LILTRWSDDVPAIGCSLLPTVTFHLQLALLADTYGRKNQSAN